MQRLHRTIKICIETQFALGSTPDAHARAVQLLNGTNSMSSAAAQVANV